MKKTALPGKAKRSCVRDKLGMRLSNPLERYRHKADVSFRRVSKDRHASVARGAAPCSERSDAKQPRLHQSGLLLRRTHDTGHKAMYRSAPFGLFHWGLVRIIRFVLHLRKSHKTENHFKNYKHGIHKHTYNGHSIHDTRN